VNLSCFLTVGGAALCFIATGVSITRTRRFLSVAQAATGKVIRSNRIETDGPAPNYEAIVAFTASDGRTVEFPKPAKTFLEPVLGEDVPLLYDPQNPGNVKLGGAASQFIEACVLAVAGAGLVIGAGLACR
jgi:hypothetical protein